MSRINHFIDQVQLSTTEADVIKRVSTELDYLRSRYAGNLLRRTLSSYRMAVKHAVLDSHKQAVIFAEFEKQSRCVYKGSK